MTQLSPEHPAGPRSVSRAAAAAMSAWLPAWGGLLRRVLAAGNENRHSRRVALLKRVLPATGVAMLLLVAVWPRLAPLWERMRLAFPAIDLRDARELKMTHPRYAGIDREGRPFVITADSGRQLADRQDLMSLQHPHGDIKTHAGADIVLTAETGIYQTQSQLLDLFGDVTLLHQNGTRFVTKAARVDAAANTAEGTEPVTGRGPSGDVDAQGFRILDKGNTILFTGHATALLKSARPTGNKAAPPALPAPVALVAVHTQIEAKPLLAAARSTAQPRPSRTAPHSTAAATPAHRKTAAEQRRR